MTDLINLPYWNVLKVQEVGFSETSRRITCFHPLGHALITSVV